MQLSLSGAKMAGVSGLRSIMDDVASSTSGTSADEWLNLSVGNPAPIPEAREMWRDALANALAGDFGQVSCRYGPSRGSHVLLETIVDYFRRTYGWSIGPENIVVGPGSQMLCFAAATIFAGPGAQGDRRVVLPMVPDYTGYQGLCMHDGGVVGVPPLVQREGDHRFRYALDHERLRQQSDIGMLLISSPGNPTSRSLSREDLDGLTAEAEKRNIPLVLDHAYGAPFPRIAEVHVEPVLHDNVINCFSASKAGLPGERIGFAIGSPRYMDTLAAFMSNSVLHAPQLAQAGLSRALRGGRLDHVTRTFITPYYSKKKRFAEQLLSELMPSDINWRMHSGVGGMFCWIWVDHDWFDDIVLYGRLKDRRVFVVPGRHFFVDPLSTPGPEGHGTRCFRISLSAEEKVIAEGIQRIAVVLREMRDAASADR
ncbi:valine--pyruvate transaminase [Streptomyces sp. NBC_00525]|uniref:valine--pyruvate transaminase n=1 Tax=Streptomyces sp. NBC_00525 TaxID=2903660 RepID=UPI002E821BB4|nr:valine--pyruvate transaminase [Streptomyces sp. NBC_00525]WUC95749.1 valine--pyruvate transaminase [Streptomyces sp. NBC_00525]